LGKNWISKNQIGGDPAAGNGQSIEREYSSKVSARELRPEIPILSPVRLPIEKPEPFPCPLRKEA